jgi:hypothetical protein
MKANELSAYVAKTNPAGGQKILNKYGLGKAKSEREMVKMLSEAIVKGRQTDVLADVLGVAPLPKVYDACNACSGAEGEPTADVTTVADATKTDFLDKYGKQLFAVSIVLMLGVVIGKSMAK